MQLPGHSSFSLPRLLGLIGILFLGLVMRMSLVDLTELDGPIRADALDFFGYASNIATSGTYSRTLPGITTTGSELVVDFLRDPGFPYFASFFYNEDINAFMYATLNAQLILNMLALLPVLVLGWRYAGYWPTFATGLLFATSPQIINMNLYFLTESLMISLMVLFVCCMAMILRGGHISWWLLGGLLLGFAALTRPYMLYFLVALLPWLLYLHYREHLAHFSGGKIAGFCLAFALVACTWSLYKSSHGNGLADTLMVGTIHHGLYPGLMYEDKPESYGYPYRADPRAAEISRDMPSVLGELQHRLVTQPGRYLRWYLLEKPLMLWSWGFIQGDREIYIYPVKASPWDYLPHFRFSLAIHKLLYYPLLLCAVLCAVLVWIPALVRHHKSAHVVFIRFVALLLIYGTGIHMIGAPFPRYHVPQLFMMYLLAVVFVATVSSAVIRKFRLPAASGNSEEQKLAKTDESARGITE